MEAPEKIYFDGESKACKRPFFSSYNIEYIRNDAFIEKAWDWIEDNLLNPNQRDKSLLYFKQFKNYMKGE